MEEGKEPSQGTESISQILKRVKEGKSTRKAEVIGVEQKQKAGNKSNLPLSGLVVH